MDSRFDSNSSGLIELSSTISIHKVRMYEIVFEIKKLVEDLQQEWQSKAGDDYVKNYNELCEMVAILVDSFSKVETKLVEVANSLSDGEDKTKEDIQNGGE